MNSKEELSGQPGKQKTGQNTVDASYYCPSTGKNLSRREQENRPTNEHLLRGVPATMDLIREVEQETGCDMSRLVKSGIVVVV